MHTAILKGIPYASLYFLMTSLSALGDGDMAKVIGKGALTLRRQKVDAKKSMPADLASKTWLFAETLANASEVFGSRGSAEEWMSKPAMGLDGNRPIDLMQTIQGAEIVNEFLVRLEYDVYS